MILKLKGCPKCQGGTIFWEYDDPTDDSPIWICLCGWRDYLNQIPPPTLKLKG